MAEQIGIGTLLGSDFTVTGYADADGRRLIRVKSRLDKLQWKRSPEMKWSREAARHFGAASTIAGGIWKNVPGGLRRLMDAGAFNRLVATCRMLQEWDGNISDFDGFRNLDLSEESYGPHRVVKDGSSWRVEGLEELMAELDRVTVVSDDSGEMRDESGRNGGKGRILDERGKMKDESPTGAGNWVSAGSDEGGGMRDESGRNGGKGRILDESPTGAGNWVSAGSDESGGMRDESGRSCAGPDAPEGGAVGLVDTIVVAGSGCERRVMSENEGESERIKRRKKIRRMAGVISEKNFKHDTGRFWERVEDVYGQEEKPRVRYWEGRGMFDYGRVTPPRIVMGQRFLRSPYVSCWPYEGNLGMLDCLNPNSPNSLNFKNGVRVRQNWESEERPDRRVRLWVQACEIGRVREVGGRAGARFELDTVGCSALGSSGYVTPWTVIRGRSDESGEMRDESGLGAGFDEGSKMKDERRSLQLDGIEGVGLSLVSHGGTGVFVVIAGIEVAEKRGRHWVRLPWCCKARVVEVQQNLQDSPNLQNELRRSEDSQDSMSEMDGVGVDLERDGMAVEFKGGRRDVGIRLPVRGDFAVGGRLGNVFGETGFGILNACGWIGLGP